METDAIFGIGYACPMKEWVQKALDFSGMKQADLVRRLAADFGWTENRSVLNKIVNGDRDLSAKEMLDISNATGWPVPGGKEPPTVLRQSGAPLSFVKVTGKVAANTWMDVDEMDFGYDDIEPVPSVSGYPVDQQFALLVEGNCLNKVAQHGDRLVCVSMTADGVEIVLDDLVIVERRRFGGQMVERTAKRVRQTIDGFELWPESTDPAHQEPIRLNGAHDGEEIAVIGKVLWILRKP